MRSSCCTQSIDLRPRNNKKTQHPHTVRQCKHQLAARLAWILKACPVTLVDDVMIANMLLET